MGGIIEKLDRIVYSTNNNKHGNQFADVKENALL